MKNIENTKYQAWVEEKVKEFESLFHSQATERNLTMDEMSERKTYYTKELVESPAFVRKLLLSALNQGEQRFAERLREGMPKEKKYPAVVNKQTMDDWSNAYGYNQCLSEISTLITSLLEGK